MNTFENKPELSVAILCYRAGEGIREFVKKTIRIIEEAGIFDYELVLVGNYIRNSDDTTPKVVEEISNTNPKIRFIAKEKEGMMGWDMRCGLNMALGNYITVIDGDGQMPIVDIVKVFYKIRNEDFDLVKTFRVERGDNYWRKIISFFYNLFFHILFPGLHARDINSKPKIIRRKAFQKLDLRSDDWFIDAEIMIQARRLGFTIGEIPTVFLGLSGRRSFVRWKTVFEFIKNLAFYRMKEFKYIFSRNKDNA